MCSVLVHGTSVPVGRCGAGNTSRRLISRIQHCNILVCKPIGLQKRVAGQARLSRVCSNSGEDTQGSGIEVIEDNGILIGSVGLFMLWGGLLSYALLLSPNQVPAFDSYLLRKFLNLEDDGVSINAVFTSLFYIMGLWPLMYTALLIPAAKTKSVKVMPFVALSYGIGAFGLLPFMALWKPDGSVTELPPREEDMKGLQNSITRGMESPIIAWGILAGTLFCLGSAAFADSQQWSDYFTLFWMSRFVHVTTVDFLTLSILAPFWMDNDARLRKWEGRDTALLPLLSCLPVLGPAIYLVLRPKA